MTNHGSTDITAPHFDNDKKIGDWCKFFTRYFPQHEFINLAYIYTIFTLPDVLLSIASTAQDNESEPDTNIIFQNIILEFMERISFPVVFIVVQSVARREHNTFIHLLNSFMLNIVVGLFVFFVVWTSIKDYNRNVEIPVIISTSNIFLLAFFQLLRKGLITNYLAIHEISIDGLLWPVLLSSIVRYLSKNTSSIGEPLGEGLSLLILSWPLIVNIKTADLSISKLRKKCNYQEWLNSFSAILGFGIVSCQAVGILFNRMPLIFYLYKNLPDANSVLFQDQTISLTTQLLSTACLLNGSEIAIEVYISKKNVLADSTHNLNEYRRVGIRLIPHIIFFVGCLLLMTINKYNESIDFANEFYANCDSTTINTANVFSQIINSSLMIINELCLSIIYAESKDYFKTGIGLGVSFLIYLICSVIFITKSNSIAQGGSDSCAPLFSAISEFSLSLLQLLSSIILINVLRCWYDKKSQETLPTSVIHHRLLENNEDSEHKEPHPDTTAIVIQTAFTRSITRSPAPNILDASR